MNLQTLAGASPSSWCVYQFRHLGIGVERISETKGMLFKGQPFLSGSLLGQPNSGSIRRTMQLQDLDYTFPERLTARFPRRPSRVALTVGSQPPLEVSVDELLGRFGPEDLLVVNETKVVPARVFAAGEIEILFLKPHDESTWEVLFPSREFKVGDTLALPGGIVATLARKGLPQTLKVDQRLDAEYFARFGEMALPPYIQAARNERHNRPGDELWYQTAWAKDPGSVAAPTASLHLSAHDLVRVANVAKITLHVGAGTFFPVRTESLADHRMHSESVHISAAAVRQIQNCQGRVWALGTTVARALESMDHLTERGEGDRIGDTNLFIYPPYQFKTVDVLLTNFHQPRSTLLALVAAFAGLEQVKRTYAWAIEREFNLFSYGDLSAWMD